MSDGNGLGKFADLVGDLGYRQIVLRDIMGKVAPGLLALLGILNVIPPDRALSPEVQAWLENPLILLPLGWVLGMALQQLGEMTGAFWKGTMPGRVLFVPLGGRALAAERARQLRHALFASGRNRESLGAATLAARSQFTALKEISGGFALAFLTIVIAALVHQSEQWDWIGGAGAAWVLLWLAHMSLASRQAKFEILALRVADLISAEQLLDMEAATISYFYPSSTDRE